ncbi:hypothetical protein E5163_16300 [Marinicauda algicola]|uniref:peptidylprolyl isomerase n=1 Tax=Marinicauda algicola TaxID=2029849 RepID=A0A4S2GW83_9PROT|nr:hypothetical protein [Marinicauda algicola]TGY87273.1 hypothetical protein E5163_16300 [Marinicauda algicola]
MIRVDARTGFALGALLGGGLALGALLLPDSALSRLPPSGTVWVNGVPITPDDVELALDAIERDSRNPLQADAREFVLDRLIDEELLFQRAIVLDLPRNESTIRRSIVLAMIDAIIAQAPAEPGDADLRALFEAERSLFTGEAALRVEWRVARSPDGPRLQPAAHPPDRLMTVTELRRVLGPMLTDRLLALDPGGSVGPIEAGGQFHWLTLLDRQSPAPADFERNRDAVAAMWRDRVQAETLERHLERLRSEAEIRYGDEDAS